MCASLEISVDNSSGDGYVMAKGRKNTRSTYKYINVGWKKFVLYALRNNFAWNVDTNLLNEWDLIQKKLIGTPEIFSRIYTWYEKTLKVKHQLTLPKTLKNWHKIQRLSWKQTPAD